MRSRIFLLALFVLCLGFASLIFAQGFETIEIGKGGPPKWSPDGTKLAFMSEGWLCVADADGKGQIQKITNKVNPQNLDWISDSEFVVFEKQYPSKESPAFLQVLSIEKVALNGYVSKIVADTTSSKTTPPKITKPIVLSDGTVGYYECEGGSKDWGCSVFKTIKQGKLNPDSSKKQWTAGTIPYPDGDIWLFSIDRSEKKQITSGEVKYHFPRLSPDNTKIVAGVSSYRAGIVVLNPNGEVLADLNVDAKEISPGLIVGGEIVGVAWAPDSKKLLFNSTIEDGHFTYDKDIYMVNTDGTGKVAIAANPNDIEKDASWSPDGNKIAYRSETTGAIFVVKIK